MAALSCRRPSRYYFFSVWGGGGPGGPNIESRGTNNSGEDDVIIEQTFIFIWKRTKIATSDSYMGHYVSKICITVTKWLPEAIRDIFSVRYQWSYNACIKFGNNRPVWYLDLLLLHMYICIITYLWMDELAITIRTTLITMYEKCIWFWSPSVF